jgi:hypothetical protein
MLLGKAAMPEMGAMGHSMNARNGATANPQVGLRDCLFCVMYVMSRRILQDGWSSQQLS